MAGTTSSRTHLVRAVVTMVRLNPSIGRRDLVRLLSGDDRPAAIGKAIDTAARSGWVRVVGERHYPGPGPGALRTAQRPTCGPICSEPG